MTTSPCRFMTTRKSFLLTVWQFSSRTVPSVRASSVDCSVRTWPTPPMWKVRIVSWVPGSPIDWAAITPTASPMFTM